MPRIKGNHNAMLSGIAAAEAAQAAIAGGRGRATSCRTTRPKLQDGRDRRATSSAVRNVKPLWSHYGLVASLALGGFDMWTNNLFGAFALRHA